MNKSSIGSIALLAALVGAPSGVFAADAAKGAELYAKKCASCHGKQGEGNPAMEKSLKVTIKPLSDKGVQAKSDADLRKDTVEGVGKMKPVKGLSDDDVANVIAHVRTLAK